MSAVCAQRQFFQSCVFSFREGDGECFWKFVFATQNPLDIIVSKLQPLEVVQSLEPVTADNWQRLAREFVRHSFEVEFMENISVHAWPPLDLDSVSVIPSLEHVGGRVAQSAGRSVPLREFLSHLPVLEGRSVAAADRAKRSRPSAHKKSHKEGLIEQYPWLQDLWKEGDAKHRDDSPPRKAEVSSHLGADDKEPLTDEMIETVFAEVQRRRDEIVAEGRGYAGADDFAVTVLGGAWTARERGVAVDAVRA